MPLITGPENGTHFTTIAVCSAVRPSAIARTSASAARYAGDPNTGGGGERSSLADARKNGRAPSPPRTVGAPVLVQYPAPTGGPPGDVSPKLSDAANASTPAAISRPIASPRAKS